MELVLSILSTVGFVLLIILLVIAVLIALVLFLPVVYKIRIKKIDKPDADVNVRWLFGAVRFSFSFDGTGMRFCLRLLGIPIMKGPKSGKSRKAAKEQEEYAPAKKQPTIRPGERAESVKNEKLSENAAFKRVESEYTSDSERKIHRLKDNEAFEEKSEPSFTEKIRFTFQKICDTLKKVKEMKALFGKVKPMLVRLLKEIFPKKIYGYVNFGLDDPAATGMILAVISALSLPVPRDLKITPFFDEKKLECDVSAKGRIFIIILLINVIKIIKLPEVRKLLKGAMPAGKGRKKHKKR